jgi:hypothetical protein
VTARATVALGGEDARADVPTSLPADREAAVRAGEPAQQV